MKPNPPPDPPEAPAVPTSAPPSVSVVMPVLNEARHLRGAVRHVLDQRYDGDLEVILAVGPSRDDSERIATELAANEPRVRCVPNPSGRTPSALNAAVAASDHDVVVRVDGHSMLPPDYVATAVATLQETGADNVGGLMAAEGTTAFEQAVARAMTTPFGVGPSRFHTGGEAGPADTVYLGVFRRSALQRVGGYDESFDRAQDWEMNYRIRGTGGLVWFSPSLRVSYRPRGSVRGLAGQYRDYGRWRRVVMRQHAGTATPRYLAPPAAVLAIGAGLVLGLRWRPALLVPGAYVAGVLAASLVTGRGLPPAAWVRLPVVYATMHGAWGVGFLTSPPTLGRTEPAPGRG